VDLVPPHKRRSETFISIVILFVYYLTKYNTSGQNNFRQLGFPAVNEDGNRLRVFENRVLRRIFGPKRDEVTGGWRKLHNEELHSL
jgi:hypothetical protein